MDCRASASVISLLFIQTSHSSQWLQSIATSKIFSVSLAITAVQPVVEDHHRLLHEPSKEVAALSLATISSCCVLCFLQALDFLPLIHLCKKTSVIDGQMEKALTKQKVFLQKNILIESFVMLWSKPYLS